MSSGKYNLFPNTSSATSRDQFRRPLRDLRIAITDRCNLRCRYCMPKECEKNFSFLSPHEWLDFETLTRIASVFASAGVTKIRLTGGEPLLRSYLTELVRSLAAIPGIRDVALTTNGTLLERHAHDLYAAGLNRLTVSLDTLDTDTYQRINHAAFSPRDVLKGIRAAEEAGFSSLKINAVILKGINDTAALNLVEHFRFSGHIVRFIEFMDVGNCNRWEQAAVVPVQKIFNLINARYPLEPLEANYYGEVATRYHFKDGGGEIGFISSVTQPFCGECTRARLTADGKLLPCLFASEGLDIRTCINEGITDEDLRGRIEKFWNKRADKYSENRHLFLSLTNALPKIEMFRIGG